LAREQLNWHPNFDQNQAIISTIKWWKSAIVGNVSAEKLVDSEITKFLIGKELA
jgi:hypothetical protein